MDGVITSAHGCAPKVIVYGPPGVGKTTFAAKAENGLIVDVENGAAALAMSGLTFARTPYLASWSEINAWLKRIEREDHSFHAIFIDTLDWLLRRIEEHVTGSDTTGKVDVERTLHKSHGGYGNGKLIMRNYIYQHLLPCLDRITSRGCAVVMIAHCRMARLTEEGIARRDEGIWTAAPDIMDGFLETFVEWSDVVAYIHKAGLFVNSTGRALAKNRFGITGDPIPFSWADLCKAIKGERR